MGGQAGSWNESPKLAPKTPHCELIAVMPTAICASTLWALVI